MRFISQIILTLLFIDIIKSSLKGVSCQSNQIDFIFSPFFQQKYDISNPQGASTKIKVAEKANLVFISAGFGGIMVIDGVTSKLIFEQKANEFLFTIEATSDGEFVMVSYQGKFSVFQFVNRNQLVLKSQSDFPTSIIDMFMDKLESVVYAVGLQGQLIAYSIKNKNAVESIGFFNAQSNIIHQGSISIDGKWILLGNDLLGLAVILVTDGDDGQQEFQLVGQGINIWKTWTAVITNDNTYVYSLDNWNGLFICDFNQILLAQPEQYPITLTFTQYWPFLEINPSVYSLKLTKDNNYLMIGVRSQGVYIFNIQDRMNPVFFQSISVGAHAFSVNLSSNEQYLYYANAISVYIFQKTPPNLNDDYPNLFNVHQAIQQQTSPAFYKWRCYTKSINDKIYYFGPFDAMGLYIFDASDPYKITQVYQKQYQVLSLVNSLQLSQGNKYLYVPIQEDDTAIQVLDITDLNNPVEVFRLKMVNPNHGEAIFFSKDYQFIVLSYDNGILLIDASNPPKLNLLDYWHILPYMTGENAGVMITNDNKWIIGTVRGYGLYLLNAQNTHNLQFTNSLQTLGAEGIIPSLYDSSYAYLYDGFKGVAILDLTVLPEIRVLSRVSLNGWSNTLLPIQNDSFLLVAQMEAGMITLVDIKDKANPKIISTYQFQAQSAQSICLSPDEEYSFINNNLGTITLPMRSKVQIHTEVQQIITNDDGTQTLITIQKDEYLQVGQEIQFNFVPLFPQEGMSIISVSYYDQDQIKSLPFWMKYDQNKRNLLLQVDQSALGDDRDKPNLNTVLLQVAIPLKAEDFLYNFEDIQTTQDQADQIYEYLQEQKLISSSGIITDLFDYTEDLNFEVSGVPSSPRLFSLVRLSLQRGSYINPVLFYVQPSLSLDIKDQNTPVKTLAQSVQFYLLVDQQFGKFVMINFPGVIASMTDSQNQLKLEGSLDNLNRVLSQKVIFANNDDISQMVVKINITDGINYSISQNQLISDCTFIKLKKQLTKNNLFSLQDQFSKQYKNNQINIQEEFSIDFLRDSFVVSDIQTITYNASILTGNSYIELTSDNWIQFQTTSGIINFHGTPPVSALNSVFNIRVTASDGYTQDYDDFYFDASGLPFLYIFNLLIKIFGPIFAIFGVYKYKGIILNLIYRNAVMFSPEIAVRSRVYKKKITVLGDDNEKCNLLFGEFINRFFSDRNEFKEETQKIKNILQRYGSDLLPETDIDQMSHGKKKKKISKSNSKGDQYIDEKIEKDNNIQHDFSFPRRLKVQKGNENIKLQNSVKIIQMSPKHTRQSPIEREYLKKDGSVSLSKILRDISHKNISFTLKGKRYSASNFMTDFKNKDCRIFKGLKAISSRYFLKQDIRSQEIYVYLKYHAQNFLNYQKNDWYRGLINIVSTDANDCYGFPVPFPELSLKEDVINLILIDLQLHNRIGQSFKSLSELDINYNLIKEVLFADALGLVENTPSMFSPCVGESIHLHSYEIGSVEAFKQVNNAWCMKIRKLINFEFMQYGMSKNMTLPNWIAFDHKNGVITLQGTPLSQDVEEFLIRIIDIDQFVIKQFFFSVVDEFCDEEAIDVHDNSVADTIADDQSIIFNQHTIVSLMNKNMKKSISLTKQPSPKGGQPFDYSQNQLIKQSTKPYGNDETNPSLFKTQNKKYKIGQQKDESCLTDYQNNTIKDESQFQSPKQLINDIEHNESNTYQDIQQVNFDNSIFNNLKLIENDRTNPNKDQSRDVDIEIGIMSKINCHTKRQLIQDNYTLESQREEINENIVDLLNQIQNLDIEQTKTENISSNLRQNINSINQNKEDIEVDENEEEQIQPNTINKMIKKISISNSSNSKYFTNSDPHSQC